MPEAWRMAINVQLLLEIGSRDDLNRYRGLNKHSVPASILGRVLNERIAKMTDRVNDENGDLATGTECVSYASALKL